MSFSIVKHSPIEQVLGRNYTVYVIWDIDKQCFFRPMSTYNKLGYGVYLDWEKAIKATGKINYRIIDICLKENIPQDLIDVQELDMGTGLVVIKIRQLIEMFVFRNDKLKDQLKAQDQSPLLGE